MSYFWGFKKMAVTVTMSSKGQIVLPAHIRERARIKQGDTLLVDLVGDKIIIEPLNRPERKDWERIIKETAGTWKDIDPDYVDELRASSAARLDENR
jgi:AbrB family looped-hinge helix DNA binding protein